MTENVRKVFDILGVEPNERFKIKGSITFKYEFYFDEKLWSYVVNKGKVDILPQILNGTYEIIKLPKKKHVGDKKCYEFSHYGKCALCPIRCLDCRGHNVVDSLYEMLKKVAIDKNKDEGLYNFLKYRLDKEIDE